MTIANPLHMAINTAIRGAGGGGGGSQRQPIESPDSLRSIAYARIVDLVSEGEIVGFADQDNPLSCVFLNETPVANADGSLNFRNIQIDSRVGTQTQDPLPNFDGVENEIAIGLQLRQATPWVRTITNTNLDSLRVRLSTPAMTKSDTENGDIKGTSVSYKIELQTDGGAYVVKYSGAMTGKTTSKYERTHRIELSPATTSWTLRVTRTTADNESATVQNTTFIESYAEIIEAKLRMPMSALVSLIVDAEQFPQIPSRAYRLKGRIIRVPSNYNPDTREYSGVWDGTFQSRYSNNPAWVFYDMALNQRYGLGHLIPQNLIDKWSLYRIAQYCDVLVDDGFGGQEPRFTCNLVLQTQNDALRVMQDLATIFRGIIYASGGAVTAVGDMPEDPVYTYSPANVVDGKFTYAGSTRKVRHTVALVSWTDLSDFGRAKVEYVDDPDGIARYGIQQVEIMAVGCTSRGQARRWGRYLLATERFETDSVTFQVGLDGTIVAPGKVVNIADPLHQGVRRSGRIKSAQLDRVFPDFMPSGVAVGDELIVTLPSGVSETHTIVQITSDAIVAQNNFSAIPVSQSVWAVESDAVPLMRYRVLAVGEIQGDAMGYSVSAIQHENGKFAYADTGVLINTPPIPDVPKGAVPPPTGLTITSRDVADQNTAVKVVNLSWDAVFVATSYNVLWRQSEGTWIDLGTTGFTNVDIDGIRPGGFEVQVMAINSFGERSVPAFGGPYDVLPVAVPPGYVGDIRGEIAQEIIDRFNADAAVAQAAADDATLKADAARADALAAVEVAKEEAAAASAAASAAAAAAQASVDALAAEVGEIVNAPDWDAEENYRAGWIVKYDTRLYRAEVATINQRPDLYPAVWENLGEYSSVAEVAAAALNMATTNASDIAAEATRLDAIYARMPVGTGELATTAMVATNEAASVTRDNALGSRTSAIEVRMPTGVDKLANEARVVAAETAAASATNAVATRTGVIEARMPTGTDKLANEARVVAAESAAASATNAVANRTTVVEAKLQTLSGPNLLINSSFEQRTSDSAVPTYYVTSASLTFTVSYPDSTLLGSLKAVRMFRAAADGGANIGIEVRAADRPAVIVGQKYVSTVYARGPVGQRMDGYIQFLNASGNSVGVVTQVNFALTADLVRYTVVSTIAAPVGAVAARAFWRAHNSGTAGDLDFTIDNAQFQQGEVATPWSQMLAEVSANVLTNEAASVTRDNALASRTSAIEVRMPAGTDLLANEARVVAAETAAATATGAVANRTTAVEAKVQNVGGDNLIPNSSLETRTSDTVAPTGFLPGGSVPSGATLSYVDSDLPGSIKALRRTGTSTAINQYLELRTLDNVIKATPGQSYVASAFMRGTLGTPSIIIWFLNAAGVTIGSAMSSTFTISADWQRMVTPARVAPAGTAFVRLYFRIQSNVASQAMQLDIDNVQLQQGEAATNWQPSAIEVTDKNNALTAVVATNETASVSRDNALGTRVGVVEARMPAGSGGLATSASVTNLQTAMTTADTALAQDITTAQTTAGGAQSTATQALTAANGAASAVLGVKNLTSGGNLLRNTSFPNWSGEGWSVPGNGWASWRNVSGDTYYIPYGLTSALATRRAGVTSDSDAQFAVLSDVVPAKVGQRYCLSVGANPTRCALLFYAEFKNSAGTVLGSFAPEEISNTNRSAGPLSEFPRYSAFGVAPAGTAYIQLALRVRGAGNQSDPYLWIWQPMLSEVPDDSSVPPPYAAGGDNLTSITQTLTANVNAKYGLYLQSGNLISGFESSNNGITADFNILATVFRITNPAGGARTEFSNGNWRVYDASGTLLVAMGTNI